jgi:pullulanase/glycogen debranching enzyme
VRFTRQAFAFRRAHAVLRREAFYNNRDIEWFDPGGCSPDWLDHSQKRLACLVRGEEGSDLYMMFNADVDPASFVLPALPPLRRWRVAADTSRSSAEDFDTEQRHTDIPPGACWIAGPRSCAILVACPSPSSTAEATLPGGTHARTASVR